MWFIITIIIITSVLYIEKTTVPQSETRRVRAASIHEVGAEYMLINHKVIHGITVGYTLLVKLLHPFIVSRYCYRCSRPSYREGS